LWAESYDTSLTDILQVQREIAGRITNSLRLELLPGRDGVGQSAHRDPEAYRKYLLGLNESRKGTREGQEKAVEYLKEAITSEPANATYHAALANVYSESVPFYSTPTEVIPLAKQSARRALELDPDMASAYAIEGEADLLFDW